jgi:hypothetical protein
MQCRVESVRIARSEPMGLMLSTFVRRAVSRATRPMEAIGGWHTNIRTSCSGALYANRNRKRASFPLLPEAIRSTYETRDTISAEQRVLIDPAEDPVEALLAIGPDDTTAKLIPQSGLELAAQARVHEVIDLFGLNTDQEVRSQRSKLYEDAAWAAAEQRWDDLRRSAMRHRPHSLAARVILQLVAPERLPSVEEETWDLFSSLWKDFRTLVDEIRNLRARDKVPSSLDERQADSLAWALLVLSSDLPARDPPAADTHLEELLRAEPSEVREEIVAVFRNLE